MLTANRTTTATNRDIAHYEAAYQQASFEPIQAALRKRIVVAQLKSWQAKRVLEVGCGMVPLFTEYTDFEHFVIVEPGSQFSRNARNLSKDDSRITIITDYLEHACAAGELSAGTFDAIVVSGLLHEIPNPQDVLMNLHELCDSQTRLHINVPNARSVHRLLALEMGLIDDIYRLSDRQQLLHQHATFDIEQLVSLCQACGYQVIGQGSYFIKPFTHDQMQTLMNQGLINEQILEGLMGIEKYMPGLGSEIYLNLAPELR
ncbi:MAG: methyltransferase domain-containing protein [Lautropia sp.]|nr:methyltransferase domain-containing protein [Lautropia sp.]